MKTLARVLRTRGNAGTPLCRQDCIINDFMISID